MKWLDDILKPIREGPTTPAPAPRKHRVGQQEGTIEDDNGTDIADLTVKHIDPNTFNVKYRLTVRPEMWEYVEVVCGGNAVEVQVEPIEGDRYRVKRKLAGYKPTMVDEEQILELPKHESTKDFINWIESLDTDAIEALRQIYYDRWTFDTGDYRDKMFYELLEEEKIGRRK